MFTRVLFVMLVAAFSFTRGDAAGIETLLMPGKVANAHAKYEEKCENCHDRSNRERQSALCLDCHKDVAADVSGKKGFHGGLLAIDRSQCRACHTDHLGRGADIVRMDVVAFVHDNTDFPLRAQHALVDCGSCHQTGKKYREAPTRCSDCHRKEDPHAGKLGNDCGACHTPSSWNKAEFDHGKTQFALHGKHADVPCLA